jgi:hypothetical protein
MRSRRTGSEKEVKSVTIPADSVLVRMRRRVKWLVAWIVIAAVVVATAPTIWHDGIANLRTYLHVSRTAAMAIILVPVGLILLIVVFVRLRTWLSIRGQHRAARKDALRNLRV